MSGTVSESVHGEEGARGGDSEPKVSTESVNSSETSPEVSAEIVNSSESVCKSGYESIKPSGNFGDDDLKEIMENREISDADSKANRLRNVPEPCFDDDILDVFNTTPLANSDEVCEDSNAIGDEAMNLDDIVPGDGGYKTNEDFHTPPSDHHVPDMSPAGSGSPDTLYDRTEDTQMKLRETEDILSHYPEKNSVNSNSSPAFGVNFKNDAHEILNTVRGHNVDEPDKYDG